MIYQLIIRPEAETEIKEAYEWYEEQRLGLGDDFLLNIDAALCSIQREPEICAPLYKNIRRILIRRFPYSIFYMIESRKVIVMAVIHAKRHPRIWKNRI